MNEKSADHLQLDLVAPWEGGGHVVVISRRVGLDYAAFYRACIEGMSGADAATWYLDSLTESRDPADIFDEVSDTLLIASRRHRASGAVAILEYLQVVFQRNCNCQRDELPMRGRPRMRLPISPLPSGARGIALRRRAVNEAITWANDTPRASDGIADWLSQSVTSTLALSYIETVGDLARLVVRAGQRWWRKVPNLGARRADKVDAWIHSCAATLIADELSVYSREVRQSGESLLQPFEKFNAPENLDGRDGDNRYRGRWSAECSWADDCAALTAWLDMYRSTETTYCSYRKMVERIWLWAVVFRGKALSSLSADDCVAYFRFLLDLPEGWIGETRSGVRYRASEDWRPFTSPVSLTSIEQHFSCMRCLFKALQRAFYIDDNPMRELRLSEIVDFPRVPVAWLHTDPSHSFSTEQWRFLLDFADANYTCPRDKRAAFIFKFCYYAGLRVSELCDLRVAHLIPPGRRIHLNVGWRLKVTGPRQIGRVVDLPESAFSTLRQYMVDRGFAQGADTWPPDAPLVIRLTANGYDDQGAQASPDRINRSMKRFFRRVAEAASETHPDWQDQIERASGLWLRASLVRHEMARGTSFVDLSRRLGYESIHTFEQFDSPPVDHAASIRNWDRHLSEMLREAEERTAGIRMIDEQRALGADSNTRRKP